MGFGKDGKGTIITESQVITLGTLGSKTAIKAASNVAITEDFRIIKTEYFIIVNSSVADTMFLVGLADNELSTTEIQNQISVNGPVDRNDYSNHDLAHKPVFLLEGFNFATLTDVGEYADDIVKGEKVFRWTFSNPEGWTWFAYNPIGAAMGSAGNQVTIVAKHYGVWVT